MELTDFITEMKDTVPKVIDLINSFYKDMEVTDEKLEEAKTKATKVGDNIKEIKKILRSYSRTILTAKNIEKKSRNIIKLLSNAKEKNPVKDIESKFWQEVDQLLQEIKIGLMDDSLGKFTFIDVLLKELDEAIIHFSLASMCNGLCNYGERNKEFELIIKSMTYIHVYEKEIIDEAIKYLDEISN